MWPFSRPAPDLDAAVRKLTSRVEQVELDLEATLDKVKHWMQRHNQRLARAGEPPPAPEEPGDEEMTGTDSTARVGTVPGLLLPRRRRG